MRFGRIPVLQAEGAILGHRVIAGDRVLKKGHRLDLNDLEMLAASGVRDIMAGQLEPDDVLEDVAAQRIADSLVGGHTKTTEAFTGRSNLYATEHGVLILDRQTIDEINSLHESVTLATLAPFHVVRPRQLIATVKVIPLAAPEAIVREATALVARIDAKISVAPFRRKSLALVSTRLPDTKLSVLQKAENIIEERLTGMDASLDRVTVCDHHERQVAAEILGAAEAGADIVLIFGASATIDRSDSVPQGIIDAGGSIVHFGMPVDPGNLMVIGNLEYQSRKIPVIGLPSCARSPKLNGVDWILQRLIADLQITSSDVMQMGVGGLLKEMAGRPSPREARNAGDGMQSIPHIAAIVLAAGQSQRMGRENKLLALIDGRPMISHAVQAALDSQASETIVITGHERVEVEEALSGADLTFVHNPEFEQGLSTSLKAGLAEVSEEADGIIILLGDMPDVTSRHVDKIIASYNATEAREICVPMMHAKRGNPVLFGSRFFSEIMDLSGDVGARHLIGENSDVVVEVDLDDPAILTDLDTQEALKERQGKKT